MKCPNCGYTYLQDNAVLNKALCGQCKKVFELTEVNAWYKHTQLEGANIEFEADSNGGNL